MLTVGTFDGVHLGHKKLISVLLEESAKIGGEPVLLTLDPHPQRVLFPFADLSLINTLEEKAELLQKAGIKHLIVYPFTSDFAQLSSSEFIENILHKQLNIKTLIVGYDHRFGKDREDNIDILKSYAGAFNIDVIKAGSYQCCGETVSSTKIRRALHAGNMEKAKTFLNYDYFLRGKVVDGNKIGRKMGFPTANIQVNENKLVPKPGVYAAEILALGKIYKAAVNIGNRPTVSNDKERTIEAHIFDFDNNLYGKEVKLIFKQYLRAEQKFPNVACLRNQIEKDKVLINRILS